VNGRSAEGENRWREGGTREEKEERTTHSSFRTKSTSSPSHHSWGTPCPRPIRSEPGREECRATWHRQRGHARPQLRRRTCEIGRDRQFRARTEKGEEERSDALLSRTVLDRVLASLNLAPRKDNNLVAIKRRHNVLPLLDRDDALLERLASAVEHVVVDRVEEGGDLGVEGREGEGGLGTVVATDGEGGGLLEVLGAELETDGDTLYRKER
jgi:hypothetical protein